MVQAVVFTWAVETDEKREGNPDQHLNIFSKNVENVSVSRKKSSSMMSTLDLPQHHLQIQHIPSRLGSLEVEIIRKSLVISFSKLFMTFALISIGSFIIFSLMNGKSLFIKEISLLPMICIINVFLNFLYFIYGYFCHANVLFLVKFMNHFLYGFWPLYDI